MANFGNLAEQYCYIDPNSCLMKFDKIPVPYDNSAVNRINVLSSESLLTRDLTDILHALRKVRNKAVHENFSEASDCPVFLQMAYSLSEWFMQTYGDWNYQHQDFVIPEKEEDKKEKVVVFNKAQEEEKEEDLTKAAILKIFGMYVDIISGMPVKSRRSADLCLRTLMYLESFFAGEYNIMRFTSVVTY